MCVCVPAHMCMCVPGSPGGKSVCIHICSYMHLHMHMCVCMPAHMHMCAHGSSGGGKLSSMMSFI